MVKLANFAHLGSGNCNKASRLARGTSKTFSKKIFLSGNFRGTNNKIAFQKTRGRALATTVCPRGPECLVPTSAGYTHICCCLQSNVLQPQPPACSMVCKQQSSPAIQAARPLQPHKWLHACHNRAMPCTLKQPARRCGQLHECGVDVSETAACSRASSDAC